MSNEWRFTVFENDFGAFAQEDDGVFILDGTDKTSMERWLGVGFKEKSSKETRMRYAEEICTLLNRKNPTNNPSRYTISANLMTQIYETLKFYANRTSYQGERIGGVLQGCPRGPKPTPDKLVRYAEQALDRINKEVLKR